jgi:hypothetical protein
MQVKLGSCQAPLVQVLVAVPVSGYPVRHVNVAYAASACGAVLAVVSSNSKYVHTPSVLDGAVPEAKSVVAKSAHPEK